MRPRILNTFYDLRDVAVISDSHIKAIVLAYGCEVYTIMYCDDVFFYHRVEAIRETQRMAVRWGKPIMMLLNGTPFCLVKSNGHYTYCYDSTKDQFLRPELKKIFKDKGIAIN